MGKSGGNALVEPAPESLTRRAALGALIAGATLSCSRKRGTGYPGLLWVALTRDRALGVVDLETFRLKQKIELGAEPVAVIAGKPSLPVVAVTPANGTLHLIDASSLRKTASFRVAADFADLGGCRVLPDGKTAAVISRSSRELMIVDLVSRKVSFRARLAGTPTHLDLCVVGSQPLIAVAIGEQGIVEQFALRTGRRQRQRVSSSVGAVRYRNDGGMLFVANEEGRSVTALDGPSLQVIADLPVAMRPDCFCFSFDQGQLFVSGAGLDAVAIVFTYQPLIVEQTVIAGRAPTAMACSEAPPYLFLANQGATEINIMSVFSRRVIAVVQAGLGARQILITPDNQYALVLDAGSGDIAVIRIQTIKGNRNKSGAALFTMIPVGDQPTSGAITTLT